MIEAINFSVKNIPDLVGENAKHVHVYAYQQNKLSPIPFQVDQIDENGLVYLDKLTEAKVSIPENLTARDLLLWMASDMGQKAPAKALAAQKKLGKWIEISMTRKSGDPKWVYVLVAAELTPVQTKPDYVKFDLEENLISSPYYYIGFKDPMFENRFSWKNDDGSFGDNLLNQIAVRFRSRILFGLIPMEVTEKDLTNTLLGYKDGQIRVVKRVRTIPQMPLGIKGPSTISDYFFYRNSYETNVKVSFPRGGKLLIAASSFRIMLDFASRTEELNLNLSHDQSFRIHGGLTHVDHMIQKDSPNWVHFSGPNIPASFVTYLKLPEADLMTFHPKDLFYKPHEIKKDGEFSGYLGSDVHVTPKKGDHTFSMNLYVIPATIETVPPNTMITAIEDTFRDPYQVSTVSTFHSGSPAQTNR